MNRPNTACIYDGPSMLDGTDVVALASGLTKDSDNVKTSAMLQVDIIPKNVHPSQAQKTGEDYAVCGDCPQRPINGGDCYVVTAQSQGGKWKSYQRGNVPHLSPTRVGAICNFNNLPVRLGSFGDAAAVPIRIWSELLRAANTGFTGYTHQWQHKNFDPRIFDYCMASVDHINTVKKLRELYPANVRYYRMTNDITTLASNEIICPSDSTKLNIDGSRTVTCNKCQLCNGLSMKAKNIVIEIIK